MQGRFGLAALTAVSLAGCGPRHDSAPPVAASGTASAAASAQPLSGAAATSTANAAPATNAPLRPAGATSVGPDAQSVALILFSITGQMPPLKEWADADAARTTSDEFARDKKAADLLAAYQAKSKAAALVGHITIPVDANVSEYDPANGEFYVDAFGAGKYIQYFYAQGTYKIDFANGDQAEHWKVSPDQAADILKRNHNSHSVQLEVSADVIGADADSNGGTIHTVITRFKILGVGGEAKLGDVTVQK